MRLRDSLLGQLRRAIETAEREIHWRRGHPDLGEPKNVDDAYVASHYAIGDASWATHRRASALVGYGWTYAEELDPVKHVRHRLVSSDGSLILMRRLRASADSQPMH